jgi:hypothetical protein
MITDEMRNTADAREVMEWRKLNRKVRRAVDATFQRQQRLRKMEKNCDVNVTGGWIAREQQGGSTCKENESTGELGI